MTLHRRGYALRAGESLEDLDMGGGSVLSMRVTGEQSNGLLTQMYPEPLLEAHRNPLLVDG